MPEVVRKLGVTEQTHYRWKREYGGLRTDQAKRLKDLEKENARLKRLLADAELATDLATGGSEGACETAGAAKAPAWRWIVHPAAAEAPEPRLEP